MASQIQPPKPFDRKDKRDALARELCQEIYASKRALGDLPKRWKRNEAIDHCDPKAVQTDVVEGAETFPMPLWTQRADRIAGSVYEGITGLEPWVQCISDDPNRTDIADKVEHDLQLLVTKSYLGPRLYRALRLATNTNLAILRLRPLLDQGIFEIQEAHPQDFIAYPAEIECLRDLKTLGTRTEKMASTIMAQIKAGGYLDCKLTPGDADNDDSGYDRAGRDDSFDKTERTAETDEGDRRCVLYDLITTRIIGGDTRTFRVLVCYSSQEILDIEEYPYQIPWFTDLRYDPEYGRFWPAGSPAQRVQGVQVAFTDGVNSILQGGRYASAPIAYCKGGSLVDVKIKSIKPGDFLELPGTAEVGTINLAGDMNATMALLPIFEKVMDGATRISSVGTGQEAQGSKTATEIGALMQGQQQGEGMYLATIADSLESYFYPLLYEMYMVHFDAFKNRWGDALEIQDPAEMDGLELRFEVTGRSGNNNPATIVQKLMMLLQVAADPNSRLDKHLVIQAVVNALQIPGSAKLFLPEDPVQGLMQAILTSLQAGMPPEQILTTCQQVIQQIAQEIQLAQSGDQGPSAQMAGGGGVPEAPQGPPTDPAMAGPGPGY
jgi:hypothetical protein